MPRDTQFQESWLAEKDSNGHLIESWCAKHSDLEAQCFLCKKTFSVRNSGMRQILQHANTMKHKDLATTALSKNQIKFTVSVSSSGQKSANLMSSAGTSKQWHMDDADRVSTAECLWTLKVVEAGYAFSSCKNLKNVFDKMFPDSKITKSFTLGPSKVSYEIAHGLGPYFHHQLVNSVQKSDSFFTLSFDEATTQAGNKQLDIHIRYWDCEQEKIICHFLCCFELGHGTANILREKILLSLSRDHLPLNRLLAIGSDGPPVNVKCLKDIDSFLKSEGLPGLINIGTCNLHIIHNSFRHGMSQYLNHWEVEDFLDAIYKFFHNFPARNEDFHSIQADLAIQQQNMLRFVSNRWLSVVPVIVVLIKQWSALKKYFLEHIPKSSKNQCQSKSYQNIKSHLEDPTTLARLLFLKSIGETFDKFLLVMQREEPLIHILYDEICCVIQNLGSRISKPELLENLHGRNLQNLDFEKVENTLPIIEIDVGSLARREALKLKEKEKKLFFHEAKQFVTSIIKYLLDKVPLQNKLLENIQCLHPLFKMEPRSVKCIARVAEKMPLVINENDIDKLCDEWKLYMTENVDNCALTNVDDRLEDLDEIGDDEEPANERSSPETRVDVYWSAILKKCNSLGEKKYHLLSRVVKAALTLSHGQADVERGFSLNRHFVNSNRPLLSETSINGLRTVQAEIKAKGDICDIPINPLCLKYFREANCKYKIFLDHKKELDKKLAAKENKRKHPLDVSLTEKKKESLQQLIQTSHSLIAEANERLSTGVKNKDFMEISAAQALLESGHRQLTETTEELKRVEAALCSLAKKAKK